MSQAYGLLKSAARFPALSDHHELLMAQTGLSGG